VLNVFPEGSRTDDGEIAPMQSGASLIVRRAEVPILPVVIDGTFRAWPKGTKWFRPTKVRVMYGQPVYVHHMKGAQITAYIDATLRRMFAELRAKERAER
jgi:1-acyl-sn-glycerol-3-phosphate acyltransferase